MKSGDPSTDLKALTGEFTPPGKKFSLVQKVLQMLFV
jgi:hypothetical protein